jgi:uncharacterized protein (UPF0297 family)
VRRFDPERAGPLYRLVYEALVELGEASVWDIQSYLIRRARKFVRYEDLRERLARLEKEGLVEKAELVGAVKPRILWRLKDVRPRAGSPGQELGQPGSRRLQPSRAPGRPRAFSIRVTYGLNGWWTAVHGVLRL